MSNSEGRLPADDPLVLGKQLLRELNRLIGAGEEGVEVQDPWLYQAYVEKFLVEAWTGACSGSTQIARACLQSLVEAEDAIKALIPPPDFAKPHIQAAREVESLVRVLEVADRCLSLRKARNDTRERPRPDAEMEVLRVLFDSEGEYLRRGEIHKRMLSKPTPGRVSQILAALDRENLLLRVRARAQGNSETWFFALSDAGRELCRALGLGLMPTQFERSGKVWRDLLRQPEAVAINDDQLPCVVAAFYGHRRGIGRSLALAHCARRIARELADRRLLVVDWTVELSDLPDYLGVKNTTCAGLRGLLSGYRSRPVGERALWLRHALDSSEYVLQPIAGLPNLRFLPLGASPGDCETAELEADLVREIESLPCSDGVPAKATEGFLGDLRRAFHKNYAKVLLDVSAEPGPLAYTGTILLSDELYAFLRPNEKNLSTMRLVVGNYLWREAREGEVRFAPITFVFSMLHPSSRVDLRRAVDNLLGQDIKRDKEFVYRILCLAYDSDVMEGAVLVSEEGEWVRYLSEDPLTEGYKTLSDNIIRPLSANIWRSRIRLLERKRIARQAQDKQRPLASVPRVQSPPRLTARTPWEQGGIKKVISAADGVYRAK